MQKQTMIYAHPDLSKSGIYDHAFCGARGIHFDKDGSFLSPIFDSGHDGMVWSHLFLEVEVEHMCIDIWIHNHYEHLQQIHKEFSPIKTAFTSHHPHVLLKLAQGRFLRFRIQMQKNSIIRGYEICFPYRSHIELLPHMYQSSEDLHLFMAPLEDAFLTLQKQIREMAMMWNPMVATKQQLMLMLQFLDLEMFLQEDSETIRQLLLTYHIWMKKKGTQQALVLLLQILLKRNVLVNVYDACVYITIAYQHDEEAKRIASIVKQHVPLGVHVHIDWLMDCQLNHSFLDLGIQIDKKQDSHLNFSSEGTLLWI